MKKERLLSPAMLRTRSQAIQHHLHRRNFLGLAAGSVLAIGCSSAGDDAGPGGLGDGKADNIEFDENGNCLSGTTHDDALGPYWTSNVKQTNMLAGPNEPGQRLMLMGRLLARDCRTAVPGALVVAWQADDAGLYDYNHAGLNQGSADGELAETQTNLRGYMTSSTAGTYSFDTIVPSEYPLNLLDPANSAYRAPHVHFAVFWNDANGVRQRLITQMYFAPNALIKTMVPNIDSLNANDGGASVAEASRFIEIDGSATSIWHGQFDIVLDIDV